MPVFLNNVLKFYFGSLNNVIKFVVSISLYNTSSSTVTLKRLFNLIKIKKSKTHRLEIEGNLENPLAECCQVQIIL